MDLEISNESDQASKKHKQPHMASYRNIVYHIVFRTKRGQKTLDQKHIRKLYAYMGGIITNNKCKLYRVNGIEDHIHILCDLHPSIALADLMRDIKASSSKWLKESGKFPKFKGWAVGYGAFTYAERDKSMIDNYIKYQQKHHYKRTYEYELRKICKEQGVKIDEKYFP